MTLDNLTYDQEQRIVEEADKSAIHKIRFEAWYNYRGTHLAKFSHYSYQEMATEIIEGYKVIFLIAQREIDKMNL